ncbi:MAG: hypothetical protein O3A84_11080 [Proteobacteria bacterium]|nr:hypothetical protein [Pseudomonadota bacterium]
MAARPRAKRPLVIDFHAHVIVPETLAVAISGGGKGLVPEAVAIAKRHLAGLKTKGNKSAGSDIRSVKAIRSVM